MFTSKTKRGRHRLPSQRKPSWPVAVAVAAMLAAPFATAGVANAGLGDPGVVGDWATYNTNDGSEDLYGVPWHPGVNQDEVDSDILSAFQARLTWANVSAANLGTSIETDSLAGEVVAGPDGGGLVAYFAYKLENGAVAGGGAPRLFVEVDGVFYNTADSPFPFINEDEGDTWGDGYDGGGAVLLPEGGTIGRVGIVYDNGVEGSVVVSAPTIGTTTVFFAGDGGGEPPVEPEAGPPHDGGQSVAEYVKEHGGPPPHANAKANR